MLSVIICTHNPRQIYLQRVLDCLKSQTLNCTEWELILVDNASASSLALSWNLDWHPHSQVVREESLGLTSARLRGFQAAQGEWLIFVDDDNLLDSNYLARVHQIIQQYPTLGAFGGKSLPEFENSPPEWVAPFYSSLALRDLGEQPLISPDVETVQSYPVYAPIGAGMAVRKQALVPYVARIQSGSQVVSDRKGNQLTSGGDNDMVLTVLQAGWQVGYFPSLQLTHIIPPGRLDPNYLARLNHDSSRSWVQVLTIYRICPWTKIAKWTVWPRQFKAFFQYQAWKNTVAYIRWRGACGLYEGLADISPDIN